MRRMEAPGSALVCPDKDVEWRDYDDTYQVSEYGDVMHKKRGVVLNKFELGGKPDNRYIGCCVHNKAVYVHKMVATAFLGPAPPDKPQCDHIDWCKKNNHYTNLKWVDPSENNYNKPFNNQHVRSKLKTPYVTKWEWTKKDGTHKERYCVSIDRSDLKMRTLHDTLEEAVKARDDAIAEFTAKRKVNTVQHLSAPNPRHYKKKTFVAESGSPALISFA